MLVRAYTRAHIGIDQCAFNTASLYWKSERKFPKSENIETIEKMFENSNVFIGCKSWRNGLKQNYQQRVSGTQLLMGCY